MAKSYNIDSILLPFIGSNTWCSSTSGHLEDSEEISASFWGNRFGVKAMRIRIKWVRSMNLGFKGEICWKK